MGAMKQALFDAAETIFPGDDGLQDYLMRAVVDGQAFLNEAVAPLNLNDVLLGIAVNSSKWVPSILKLRVAVKEQIESTPAPTLTIHVPIKTFNRYCEVGVCAVGPRKERFERGDEACAKLSEEGPGPLRPTPAQMQWLETFSDVGIRITIDPSGKVTVEADV